MFDKLKQHLFTEIYKRKNETIKMWHVHTLLAFLILTVTIALVSIGSVATYNLLNGKHFAATFSAPLKQPKPQKPVKARASYGLPSSFHVNYSYLPLPGNQGPLGSCQAWAIYNYQLAYQFNTHYGYKWGYHTFPKRFSSRFGYDFVTDGQDNGSNFLEDVQVAQNEGIPLWKYLPYGNNPYGLPHYGLESRSGIPGAVKQHLTKFNINMHGAFNGTNAGYGGVSLLKQDMVQHTGVANLDIPVFPEWDNASYTNGKVGLPLPGERARGGHAVSLIGFDDNLQIRNPDGTTSYGAFIGINQWGRGWGGTINLGTTDGTNGGYFALSYDFVAKYGWAGYVNTANWPASPPQLSYGPLNFKNPHPHTLLTPPVAASRKVSSGTWYVNKVYTRDLNHNFDIAPYLNALGNKYGIAPVGLASVLFSECGLDTGNGNYNNTTIISYNDDCSRYGAGEDVSFGACQVIPPTALAYKVGNGTFNQDNINYVHWWENHPIWCANMSAFILAQMNSLTSIGFPSLDVQYNCGSGWSTYQLRNPYTISNQCGLNHDHFLGWYYYVADHYGVPNNPSPNPITFNAKKWCAFALKHHTACIPYKQRSKITYGASLWFNHGNGKAGAVISKEQYYGPNKHQKYGFITQRFANQRLYWWPLHPWLRWQKVHHIS